MSRLAPLVRRLGWPKSLFGRVATVLFAALAVAHVLTLLWLLGGRAELGRRMMFGYLAQDVASSVAILERVPPDERAQWLPRIARANYRYRLEPVSAVAAGAVVDDSTLGRQIVESLSQALGATRVQGVQTGASGHEPDTRFLRLRLADGTPLTLELSPMRVGVSGFMLGVVVLQFALFAGAAWYGVRVATRPLSQLAEAADAIDPDLPSPALPEHGPIEIARAAIAFNAMKRRIAEHLAERARILAAVSHDLQTPITRMRLRADLLDDGVLKDKLHSDLAQMQALVEEGIAYARSAHAALESPCRVDLNALLDALVCEGVDAGQAVSFSGESCPVLATRPHALRRLVGNLIDNAVKFAGAAEVTLARTADGVDIAVCDRGPGIPEDQHAAVLQPFRRLEDSRSRDTGGTGLGLAIADQLARVLGGEFVLRNREGGGLEARLRLPLR